MILHPRKAQPAESVRSDTDDRLWYRWHGCSRHPCARTRAGSSLGRVYQFRQDGGRRLGVMAVTRLPSHDCSVGRLQSAHEQFIDFDRITPYPFAEG